MRVLLEVDALEGLDSFESINLHSIDLDRAYFWASLLGVVVWRHLFRCQL